MVTNLGNGHQRDRRDPGIAGRVGMEGQRASLAQESKMMVSGEMISLPRMALGSYDFTLTVLRLGQNSSDAASATDPLDRTIAITKEVRDVSFTFLAMAGVATAGNARPASCPATAGEAPAHFYPSDSGFLGETTKKFLYAGERIDRYGGSAASRFFSPAGTPAAARGLPPTTAAQPLKTFEVMKPFEVEAGVVAPAFGGQGLGTQFRAPVPLETLLRRGVLREVVP
jgi:hypothetical protein